MNNSAIKTSIESALYMSVAPNSLRNSRATGILCGVPAPKHLKMGRSVRYKTETLNDWLSQFEETSKAIN